MVYAVKKIPSISASRKLQNKKACGARLAHRRCGFTLPNRYPLKTRKKTKRLPTNVRSAICKQAQPAGFVLQKKIPCHKREWTDKIKTEPGTRCASRLSLAKNRNFDRNPLRGCNYGLEGGAFSILGGCNHGFRGCITLPMGTAINRRR